MNDKVVTRAAAVVRAFVQGSSLDGQVIGREQAKKAADDLIARVAELKLKVSRLQRRVLDLGGEVFDPDMNP